MTGKTRTSTPPAGLEAVEPMTGTQAQTYQRLRAHLSELRLTAAAESLTAVLDAAREQDLSAISVLERLLGIEVAAVQTRRHAGLLRFASLPAPYAIEDFDFTAQPGVDEKLVRELASLRFLEDAGNVLLIGQPGTGKTMIAIGLARGRRRRGAQGLLHHRGRSGQTLQTRSSGRALGDRDAVLLWPTARRGRPSTPATPS